MNQGNFILDEDAGTLSIEEVSDIEKFRALRVQWNELLQKSSDNNIFLTWEWLFNWWKHYGRDMKLRIITIREADKIVGIVPLMQVEYSQGFISVNVLENLCSEECDYSGIILAEKNRGILAFFMDYLAKIMRDENLIARIYHIPENSAFLTLLREKYPSFSKSLYFDEKPSSYCSHILLPSTWEEYFSTLGAKMRKNLRRETKLLERDHAVEFRKYAGAEDLRDQLQVLFELHQKRWGIEHINSKFIEPKAREFYVDVSKAFYQNNWLDFSFLHVDGKPLSTSWGFIYNNTYYDNTGAFDVDYLDLSLGTLHEMKLIERAIQYGLGKFDFLKGIEPYKSHWSNGKTDNFRITIAQNSFRGRYRAKLFQILIKIGYARERGLRENVNLLLKKLPQFTPSSC
jgi:CelD/BcsL family acetyltransferase involved in cellulose biosynthesis